MPPFIKVWDLFDTFFAHFYLLESLGVLQWSENVGLP